MIEFSERLDRLGTGCGIRKQGLVHFGGGVALGALDQDAFTLLRPHPADPGIRCRKLRTVADTHTCPCDVNSV